MTQSRAELLWSGRELTTKVGNSLGLSLYTVPQSVVVFMGIKKFDYETKVKVRSERQNLQTASQLCTKQVGTGEINQIIQSLLKVKVQRIAKTYLIET